MRGAGVGLTRTKENDMTQDTYSSKEIKSVLKWVERQQSASHAYLAVLAALEQDKEDQIADRRSDDARIAERNSNEAIRKSIYDTPPYDTPWLLRVSPNRGE
jgi:hypothetical protein